MLAGINAARLATGREPVTLPENTMLGALCQYIARARPDDYQPTNAAFGLLPPPPRSVRRKRDRRQARSARALRSLAAWMGARGEGVVKGLDTRVVAWAREGEGGADGRTRELFAELVDVFEDTETVFAEKVAQAANLIVELEVILSEGAEDLGNPGGAPKTRKKATGKKPARPLKHDTPVKFIKGVGPRRAFLPAGSLLQHLGLFRPRLRPEEA